MIDICCVGSGVKYHPPSYWSIVTSYWSIVNCHRWNFRPVNFATNRYKKSFKMAKPNMKKIKDI